VRAYVHILARLVLCWGHLPSEVVAAAALAVPGIVGFLAGLSYVPGLVASGLVGWWCVGIFRDHVWPDIPSEHRRLLVALRDLALLKKTKSRPEGPALHGCWAPRRLRGMIITILPHARDQMGERRITDTMVRGVLSNPAHEYPGDWGRTVAEGQPVPGRRSVVKVVYNRGLRGECIVVSVMRGRPRR
jgi:hypothetical protein